MMRDKLTTIAATALTVVFALAGNASAQESGENHHPQVPAAASKTPPLNQDASSSSAGAKANEGELIQGGRSNAPSEGMSGIMACPMMGAMERADTPPRVDGRIAFLKAELSITERQEPVWDAYAAALRDNIESLKAMRHTMAQMAKSTSPLERLEMHITVLESRLTALKRINPALAALYGALSDEQKQTADQILTPTSCLM